MNYSFLVDVNLPKYFSFFNDSNYTFVSDLNLQMTDTEIWNYALKNNLIILTKDVDFFNRFIISDIAPKIIYFLPNKYLKFGCQEPLFHFYRNKIFSWRFQLGNFSLKQLFHYFEENWVKIQSEIENSRLIIAKDTHIESIH